MRLVRPRQVECDGVRRQQGEFRFAARTPPSVPKGDSPIDVLSGASVVAVALLPVIILLAGLVPRERSDTCFISQAHFSLHLGGAVVNLLPWLLDWPPRPASIVAFLLLTAFSVGTLALFAPVTDQIDPDDATVETTNVSVHLNDEISMPDRESDTVATCLGSGTPGDHLTVRADILVETPLKGGSSAEYAVDVSIDNGSRTTAEPVRQTGRDRVSVLWVVRDDESFAVGETAAIHVRLRESGAVVATSTRTVRVENGSRSYDCGS